ncbi:MAG TPA: methyltransferase domain-containing protein [Candidatus Binatia bacterium]|jgi:SAM-dependent methyltransferase
MRAAPDPDPRALGALYDEGYYHGVNSGYPSEGYERAHTTFAHWVEHLARRCAPDARWLDLGCAYGYLVAEARAGGFRSVGVDVSAYALAKVAAAAPSVAGRVARGVLERLPFPDRSFDVVSAFDVLEHVVDPETALREIHRLLRPGGVLVAATPDPLLFDRHEPTHFSERPPAFWIDRLLALAMQVDFRFYQAPFNLELLATRADAPALVPAACLRWDGFATEPDLPRVSGEAAGRVALRLRTGFGSAGPAHPPTIRWIDRGPAAAYLLIAGRAPVALRVVLEVQGDVSGGEVTVALDDQRLGYMQTPPGWRTLETAPVPIAAGGHALRLQTSAPLLVRRLEVVADPATREALVARLPFDMHQRYAQCRAVLDCLPGTRRTLLDVGGVLGGAGGHLGTSADFFPDEVPPISTDVRASDHPDHRVVPSGPLPFADASFDVVLCLDVLEHVPREEREDLLHELARVSRRFVLLAAPFATAGVSDADRLLFATIEARHGYAHEFLRQHLAHGHPELAGTLAHWEARGARVVVLPNGWLPYWQAMQLLNLPLAEPVMGERYARAQTLYNTTVRDWREPAYRHLLVIDLRGGDEWCEAVRALGRREAAAAAAPAELHAAAAALSTVVDLARATEPTGA